MYCAPKYDKKNSYTCYDVKTLEKLYTLYNKYYPDDKIHCSSKSKSCMYNELRKKMSNKCNTEWCWLDQPFTKPNVTNKSVNKKNNKNKLPSKETIFRPELPKDKYI